MARRERGFTMIEMAVVTSILALTIPGLYLFARTLDDHHQIGLWHLEVADGVRTAGEELRADARAARLLPGEDIRFQRPGPCSPISYVVAPGGALVRGAPPGCEPPRALATHVVSARRVAAGVELGFQLELRPGAEQRRTVFLPVGE
ncbi:MAG TPA: type II secretion system protein [Myxococcales bacterium]|nr:type II secretion system protein [Myxococcales bacterium]